MEINVAFICIGNSCRSQMAEGFTKTFLNVPGLYPGKKIFIYSAGTHPAFEISPNAVMVMEEKGIDISDQYPKTIEEIPPGIDILITMGCDVECPQLPSKYREDWGIDDPIGMPVDFFRSVRDTIEVKVKQLMDIIKMSGSLDELIKKLSSIQKI